MMFIKITAFLEAANLINISITDQEKAMEGKSSSETSGSFRTTQC
jgi:hypothetical protein